MFCVAILMCSCQPTDDLVSNTKVVKAFHPNGNLKTVQQFIQDTIQHGYYKRYYPDGTLEILINYAKGLKHGETVEYYEDGTVQHTESWEKGVLEGKAKWYSRAGVLLESSNFQDGQKVGEVFTFFYDATPKSYLFYDYMSNLRYRVDYSKNKMVLNERGAGIPELLVTADTLLVGDTFFAEINTIRPPHVDQAMLEISQYDESGSIVDKSDYVVNEGLVDYSYVWNSLGTKKIEFKLTIETGYQGALSQHSMTMEVLVFGQ